MARASVPLADNDRAERGAEADILSAMLDRFIAMILAKDRRLFGELWNDHGFCLVGSEAGEICPTREAVEAKLEAIFGNPNTLTLEFPRRRINVVGDVGWVFAEGILKRQSVEGTVQTSEYLANCIFQRIEGVWRWRQFFGSEPS